jgi:hypothetical protein
VPDPALLEADAASNWRRHEACVDYLVYVRPLPSLALPRWQDSVARMRVLGVCQDTSFGVTTVRGPWGFFQIPAYGFPELKVTFFQVGEPVQRRHLLHDLNNIFGVVTMEEGT